MFCDVKLRYEHVFGGYCSFCRRNECGTAKCSLPNLAGAHLLFHSALLSLLSPSPPPHHSRFPPQILFPTSVLDAVMNSRDSSRPPSPHPSDRPFSSSNNGGMGFFSVPFERFMKDEASDWTSAFTLLGTHTLISEHDVVVELAIQTR